MRGRLSQAASAAALQPEIAADLHIAPSPSILYVPRRWEDHTMDAATIIQSDADTQARLDLAAVYRLLAHHGWGDVIFNHAAMRVPSTPNHFLIKRHELLYTEGTASNLVEVSMDDDLDERSGINRPGFTLHSGVLRGRPDIKCSIHVHPEEGIAL